MEQEKARVEQQNRDRDKNKETKRTENIENVENKENIEKNNTTDTSKNIENTEIGTTKKDYDEGKKVLVNVFSVVDGDTLKVTLNNEKYTVRLVGVDTPESVHPNKEKNTVEGKIASDYTKSRLQDKNVYVQKDVSGTDRYRKTSFICIPRGWNNVQSRTFRRRICKGT